MRLARIYFDVDMRCSFDGIRKFLEEEDFDVKTMNKGDLIIFLNRKMTMFKMLAGDKYLVNYSNGTSRIPLEAIQYLPTYFDGSELQFSQAIEKSVKVKLKIRD